VPIDGCWPLAPSYDTAGPMARDVAGCERMMEALAPGYAPVSIESLGDLRVGVAWTDVAEPLVRARVEEAAAWFPHRRPVDLPMPDGVYTGFAREVVEVHADLFRDHEDLYGPTVAFKMRNSLKITDAEVSEALRARQRYRDRVAELMGDVDLILTPTVPMVAPPSGIGDLELRGRMLSLTFPWNAIGAPALALPCGVAEDGLPASVQILGKPGDDALVLAAGRLLESALRR
jgi:aspartyl-tRNA(Asn)/glutamyl-tRNA(Gln) amidotransferase subunit A